MDKIGTRRYHKIALRLNCDRLLFEEIMSEVILKVTQFANENSWLNIWYS